MNSANLSIYSHLDLISLIWLLVIHRYPYQLENIESFVLDIIRDQFVKRQVMDASAKSLIKLMTATCGYPEVRQLAAQKLELWLQNPKVNHLRPIIWLNNFLTKSKVLLSFSM